LQESIKQIVYPIHPSVLSSQSSCSDLIQTIVIVAIKNILLFVTAATALPAISKRTASTVLSDISTIDSDVKALTSATNSYDGGLLAAAPVSNDESTLEKDIKQGTSDAQATPQLSSSDTQATIAQVRSPLTPDVKDALDALVAKKSLFTSAGLKSTVQNDLATLKTDTDSFADALIAIADDGDKSQAMDLKATIDSYFESAVNSYAS